MGYYILFLKRQFFATRILPCTAEHSIVILHVDSTYMGWKSNLLKLGHLHEQHCLNKSTPGERTNSDCDILIDQCLLAPQ
mmetsp:Transcript_36247/g.53080  ORF Transcript_36247/g.53080 Transcript_36247/m.53080 type:complete len:80 (+) Transcript_36247:378-617(+)